MGHLIICIAAALAMATSVYNETASLFLAFAAYSVTGTFVLFSILLTDMFAGRDDDDQFNTTE